MRKFTAMAITVVIMMSMLVACGGKKEEVVNSDAVKAVNGKKELVMGTSADYPPYEDLDASTQEIKGFDVDIAKYIGDKLGFTVKIENIPFDSLLESLKTKKVDFVMAGMIPNSDRKKDADFTEVYFEPKNTIVAKKDNNLKTLADLSGKKIGAQAGSIQEATVNELGAAEIQLLGKISEIIDALKSDTIEAAVIEDTIAKGFTADNVDLEFTTVANEGASGLAIALPKGSDNVKQFSTILKEMKTNGELDKLIKKWFEK
jgi:ABC-type amino acid transport substrate-binding protein